jgi:hypothetical protein
MLIADPRCAELEEMLRGLDPRSELVYRFALREISEHCRDDRRFELQTLALQALLRLDEDERAGVMREARVVARKLTDAVSA